MLLLSWFPCALLVTDEKDSSESLWPCITKWTLIWHNFLTTLMNVFTDFFLLECSNDFKRIMQIWACAVKWFENVQKLSIKNSNFKINTVDYFVNINFKIQIQIRKQFYLMVCWRSWQHDTDFGGCEVGLLLSFFEIKSNQHKFWQSKPPRQMKIFNFGEEKKKKKIFFSQWLYLE